jgi:phospholipid/cholesterol/gamma-HCH transport system ATP-binding protein
LNQGLSPLLAARREVIIRVRGLKVGFGERLIMDGLDLDLYRGEVLGFVGASGAGKSVLTRTILGLLPKRAGTIEVFGYDIDKLGPQERLLIGERWGVLFQEGALFSSLTVRQNIQTPMREHLNLSQSTLDGLAAQKLALVGLPQDAADKYPSELSGGMTKRVSLARALALDPEIVFLDEPTSGLDPIGRRLVRDIIKAQRDRGTTVLLNSHLLGEVEITCDRVAFIRDGEVVETRQLDGECEEQTTVSIRAVNVTAEVVNGLSQWTSLVRSEGERLTITLSSSALLPGVVRYLVTKGADVYEVTPRRLSLEERFLEIVGSDGGL